MWNRIPHQEVDQFTGLHIVAVAGTDDVEATGFTAHHPLGLLGFPDQTEHQGADAVAIPQGEQTLRSADHQTEGPATAGGGAANGGIPTLAAIHRLLEGKGDQFRIGGGGELAGEMAERLPQLGRVHQIAVVGQGEGTEAGHQHHGLGIADLAAAGGGISIVANRQFTGHALEHVLVEHLAHQPHVLVEPHMGAIEHGDAGRFLAAVLQGV